MAGQEEGDVLQLIWQGLPNSTGGQQQPGLYGCRSVAASGGDRDSLQLRGAIRELADILAAASAALVLPTFRPGLSATAIDDQRPGGSPSGSQACYAFQLRHTPRRLGSRLVGQTQGLVLRALRSRMSNTATIEQLWQCGCVIEEQRSSTTRSASSS